MEGVEVSEDAVATEGEEDSMVDAVETEKGLDDVVEDLRNIVKC